MKDRARSTVTDKAKIEMVLKAARIEVRTISQCRFEAVGTGKQYTFNTRGELIRVVVQGY